MDPTGGATMAKKKAGRPKGEVEYATMKVEKAIITRLKAIAQARGGSAAEIASEMLRAIVAREYAKVLRELEEEGRGG